MSNMETIVNRNRVREIAEKYILPFPYDPTPEKTFEHCYFSILKECSCDDDFKHFATDEHLEQIIDEYFNL